MVSRRKYDRRPMLQLPNDLLEAPPNMPSNIPTRPGNIRSDFVSRTSHGLFGVLTLMLMITQATAQLGETVCACSPSAYLLKLNVGLPCSDGTLAIGDGIADIDCVTNPTFTGSPSDLNITSVTFLELDQNLQLLTSSTVTDNLKNGDTVEFASYTVNPDQVTLTKLPSTIEVGIMAQDKDRNSILTNWVVSFSNACDEYPVISVGDSIGWTEFANVRPPPGRLCPMAATPTTTPTASSPTSTTSAPTITTSAPTQITAEPTTGIIMRPSSKAPTAGPTASVTKNPTMMPHQPTHMPVPAPTTHVPVPYPYCGSASGSGGYGKGNNIFERCYKSAKASKGKGSKAVKGGDYYLKGSKKAKGSKGYVSGKGYASGSGSSSGGYYHPAPTARPHAPTTKPHAPTASPHAPTLPPGGSAAVPTPGGSQVAPPGSQAVPTGTGSQAAPTTSGYYYPLPASSPSATGSVPWVDQTDEEEDETTTGDGSQIDGNNTDSNNTDTMPPVTQVDDDGSSTTSPISPASFPAPGQSPADNTSTDAAGLPDTTNASNASTIIGVLVGGGLVMVVMGLGIRHVKQRQHARYNGAGDNNHDHDAKRVDMTSSESTMGLTTQQGDNDIYHLESHDIDSVAMGHVVELDPLAPVSGHSRTGMLFE